MTSAQRETLIHARYALDRAVSAIVGGDDIVLSDALEKAIWACIDAINEAIPEDKPTEFSDIVAEQRVEIQRLRRIIREARNA